VAAVPARHCPVASQHPVGQLVASQTHAPPLHRRPAAQAAPVPHEQTPVALHRSARTMSHAAHVVAGAPHAASDWPAGNRQLLPLQHPVVHDALVQAQAPVWQTCPAPHALPAPHRQTPAVQRSVDPEHGAQAAPPVPQAVALCAACWVQAPALQQPVGQLVASHTHVPAAHRWPLAQALEAPHRQAPAAEQLSAVALHAAHAAPPVLHCVTVGGLTHAEALQQPFGQLAALHTHVPATHAWPTAHALPAPHRQLPFVQPSEVAGLHAMHTAPAVPHCESEGGVTQAPFEQQPAAQLAAVQPLHVWLVHVCGEGQFWQTTPPAPQAAA
jgi:hypothetical protein